MGIVPTYCWFVLKINFYCFLGYFISNPNLVFAPHRFCGKCMNVVKKKYHECSKQRLPFCHICRSEECHERYPNYTARTKYCIELTTICSFHLRYHLLFSDVIDGLKMSTAWKHIFQIWDAILKRDVWIAVKTFFWKKCYSMLWICRENYGKS